MISAILYILHFGRKLDINLKDIEYAYKYIDTYMYVYVSVYVSLMDVLQHTHTHTLGTCCNHNRLLEFTTQI